MNSLQDTLYNWLSIKVVSDMRPADTAAQETTEMFQGMLEKEYEISSLKISQDEEMYYIVYVQKGQELKHHFPKELIDCMLNDINEHPERYKNYK